MTRIRLWPILSLILVIFFSASLGLAQKPGRYGKDLPRYDPATEVTIVGTVEEVREYPSPKGWMGTHLIVNVGDELIEVEVGPSAFLVESRFAMAKGDEIQVTGSEQKIEGACLMIARRIVKGDQILILRSPYGIPMWSDVPNP